MLDAGILEIAYCSTGDQFLCIDTQFLCIDTVASNFLASSI